MSDIRVDLIECFKTAQLQELSNTTRATMMYKVRCFLRAAFRRGWIKEPLVDRITAVKAVYEQKQPYTDEEVNAILAESERLNGGTHGYAGHPHTFRLLLELMLETGMRVGDAIHFDPRKLQRGQTLWIYTYVPQKQKRTERKRTCEAFISEKLKTAIDECDWLTPGRRLFHYGTSTNPAYLANEVYARMQTMGERCNVADCRPHRLRDTFAIRCLLDGLSLDEVSRLLGHSSVKVTELYYAPWVNARKSRLERVLSERKTRP